MMRTVFCSLLAALMLAVPVARAQAETLADAFIAAYRNSNLLDQNRALLRATDEDVAIAVSDRLCCAGSLCAVRIYKPDRRAVGV